MRALAVALLLASLAASAADAPSRYTFSWPVGPDAPAPRGGTTRGPAIALDADVSDAWRALQDPLLPPFERDRRAILAMAGSYRVAFDFLEIASFGDTARPRPYQSWGTERVYVDEDSGRRISLVHVLEMRVVGDDGKVGDPVVTKHWRQDWVYEPRRIIEYQGETRWRVRTLNAAESKGQWSQTVYQVDESPRYASIGHWEHNASFSSWLSGDTARPLPRREWSVRKDYQMLLGTNRHTILPRGWLQEENNLKATAYGAALPFVGREYGVARYERIKDPDFSAADRYYESTRRFWDAVLEEWNAIWERHGEVKLFAPVDQSGSYASLSDLADRYAEGNLDLASARDAIRASLASIGASAR